MEVYILSYFVIFIFACFYPIFSYLDDEYDNFYDYVAHNLFWGLHLIKAMIKQLHKILVIW